MGQESSLLDFVSVTKGCGQEGKLKCRYGVCTATL